MKRLIYLMLPALLLAASPAFAVILDEAPRNKAVAFKKQYNCTDGEWRQVTRQVTNHKGLTERYVGYKCVRAGDRNSQGR
ncbi:MAG: hypothetical protein RRB13_05775 [bacterium]|nr:hypothetical protein [bacterium]